MTFLFGTLGAVVGLVVLAPRRLDVSRPYVRPARWHPVTPQRHQMVWSLFENIRIGAEASSASFPPFSS